MTFILIKFAGTSVEGKINGKGKLKLLNHGETYELNSPNLWYRILPVPGVDWVGTTNLRCLETGLIAELSYKSSHSYLGLGGNHKVIKGKIFDSTSSKVMYEIDGQWDRYYITPSHIVKKNKKITLIKKSKMS
jgi:hypothetical protein